VAKELERFKTKLTFLIESTPMGVIEWNSNFEVVGWNPAAEKIFGYQAIEMLNNHALEIVPEPYQAYVVDIFTDLMQQKGGTYSINENIAKDGRVIICEWINTPLLDENDHPIGIYSMVQDITDRKRIEAERQQKSEQLEEALRSLQQTQLQLVQGEKMSALGNLVAGVAHEINNPIGFLSGNISPALDYIKDLFGLLDLYQQKYPQLDPDIQAEIETIDLEYIREDLPKLVGSMREGIKRIKDISTSLRTFSRADSDRPIPCNIHDGIDSTIMILKHRLKANSTRPEIKVIKEYGDLPQVECFAGQLNQVFMNILANAIDALEESNQRRSFKDITTNSNRITIRTSRSDSQHVKIQIADNGAGMTEEVREHIFDHLFTTKGVGKGTGLGLAIAGQIVEEKHGGAIAVKSSLGEGTEFSILLPLKA
jgi:PAS domain S-box-containing protein